MVSAAISRVAMTSPGEERKILSCLITAADIGSSVACRHVDAPGPRIAVGQPVSAGEGGHDRHSNLMKGTYDVDFVLSPSLRRLWHYISDVTKQKPRRIAPTGFRIKSLAV